MTDLDLIREAKKGNQNAMVTLFDRYKFMIYKHAKFFPGYEEDYKQDAYPTLMDAVEYFDMKRATTSNYKFMKVYWWYLNKQDKEFAKNLSLSPIKKEKISEDSISMRHEQTPNRVTRKEKIRYYRNNEVELNEEITAREETEDISIVPVQMAILKNQEKVLLAPRGAKRNTYDSQLNLTPDNRRVYECMKQGIVKATEIQNKIGMDRRLVYYHIKVIRRKMEAVSSRGESRQNWERKLQ